MQGGPWVVDLGGGEGEMGGGVAEGGGSGEGGGVGDSLLEQLLGCGGAVQAEERSARSSSRVGSGLFG